ncbi:MAG: holin [Actinomycetes bacterium]|jgi:hypothetical protein
MLQTSLLTKVFWFATVERAVKTFAQTLVAVLSAGQLGLFDVAWVRATSTATLAAVISVLTSVGSAGTGGDGPSLGAEVTRQASGATTDTTAGPKPGATEPGTVAPAPALALSE